MLKDADLLYRFKRSERSDGEYRFRPTGPNQQWNTAGREMVNELQAALSNPGAQPRVVHGPYE